MNLAAIQKRYEAFSLRERAFVMLALLGVLVASIVLSFVIPKKPGPPEGIAGAAPPPS